MGSGSLDHQGSSHRQDCNEDGGHLFWLGPEHRKNENGNPVEEHERGNKTDSDEDFTQGREVRNNFIRGCVADDKHIDAVQQDGLNENT